MTPSIRAKLSDWFEISASHGSDRFASMEGLRGLAILLVFCAHYYDIIWRDLHAHSATLSTLGDALTGAGGTGVDLFFVLSGFLIYGAVLKSTFNPRKFLARRARRIYPTFLAVFALYLAMSPFLHTVGSASARYSNRVPGNLVGGGLYVIANLAFLPGIFPIQPVMNVAWSLSYEWFYYLSLPLAAMAIGLWRQTRRVRVLFFLMSAVVFLAANIAFPAFFYLPANPGRPGWVEGVMFVGGILLFEAVEAGMLSRWPARLVNAAGAVLGSAAVAAGAVFGIAISRLTPPNPEISEAEALLSSALFVGYTALVFAALTPGTLLQRVFAIRPVRWLGNMSYSFYLIHGLPLHVFGIAAARLHAGSLTGPALWLIFTAAFPIAFLFTAACSAVLFLFVEKPLSLAPAVSARATVAFSPAVVTEG